MEGTGDDSTGPVFLVLFFLIPFLARENDSGRAMTWQGIVRTGLFQERADGR